MWAPLLKSPRHGVMLSISDSLMPGLTIFIYRIWSLLDRLNGTIVRILKFITMFIFLLVNSARNVRKSPRFLMGAIM